MSLVFSTTLLFSLLHNILILSDPFSPNFQYCSRSTSYCREACSCASPKCLLLPMDDDTREEILLHHNKIRNLQTKNLPQPSGLSLLEYDLELEDVSSCWASRCEDEVSECFRTPSFSEVSQTVGQLILEEDDLPDAELWEQMMNTWLVTLEELPLEMLYISNDNKDLSEHNLAQILSDKILFMGCAWSLSDSWIFFVCSYGPKGPKPGDDIYKVGDICSTCPEDYECFDVMPFERLCKSKSYRRMEGVEEGVENNTIVNEDSVRTARRRNRPKSSRIRSLRAGDETEPKKKKNQDDLPIIVGVSVFIVLFVFFALFGVYAYVVSRVSTDAFF